MNRIFSEPGACREAAAAAEGDADGRRARARNGVAALPGRGGHDGGGVAHSAATWPPAGKVRASRISSVPLIWPLRPSS